MLSCFTFVRPASPELIQIILRPNISMKKTGSRRSGFLRSRCPTLLVLLSQYSIFQDTDNSVHTISDAGDMLTEVGWRAKVSPSDHPVSEYVFDVCISADGKRNTLQGIHSSS